jgi:glycosyltransferase involved in cell wall biosynthesis
VRLLYLITRAEIGGAQAHVLELARGFSSGHRVHLATGQYGPLTEAAKKEGVLVHQISSLERAINPLRDTSTVFEVTRLIRQIKPDIVHAHSSKAGIVGRIAARRAGVPVIFTAHGWGFARGARPSRRIVALCAEKIAAPLACRIVCVSEHDKKLALRCKIGSERSLKTIYYGIRALRSENSVRSEDIPTIIMVARFSEQKDQNTLIQAFQAVRKTGLSARLLLVGTGPLLGASRALVHQLGLDKDVVFTGDRHDVPELLAQSNIFALTTHYEGLPISILEAMRAGLPVVATDVDGIPEQVTHSETGFLVPHRSVQHVAQGLLALITDSSLRRKCGDAGRVRFEREFVLERMLERIDSLYTEVLAQRRAS